jgi:hemin uptake protein HemP
MIAAGLADAADADRAFAELVAAERQVEVDAILGGEGFQTLWPPQER